MAIAYQSSDHHQVINFLEFYIESITHVSDPNSSLSFDWKSSKRQSICILLFAAILGLGIVCLVRSMDSDNAQNTQNPSVIHTLTALLQGSFEDKPINLMRYHLVTVISLALVTRTLTEVPPWNEESQREPHIGHIFATGIVMPVEERPGLILAHGFFSSHNLQLFSQNTATHFVSSQRQDVVFFYGTAVALAGFLKSSLEWLPEQLLSDMDYHEDCKEWYCFLGGVAYAGSLMRCDEEETYVQWIINLLCHYIQTERTKELTRFPSLFLTASLHAVGYYYTATLDKKILILLRTLYLAFVSSHQVELIQATATSIGLVALFEGQASFMCSRDVLPLHFLSFLPVYPSQLGGDSLLLDMFRQLWRCCPVRRRLVCLLAEKQSLVEVDARITFEDGSTTVCRTPGYVDLSNMRAIEVMSGAYQVASAVEEVRENYRLCLREKRPLFQLNAVPSSVYGVTLTREEQLRIQQSESDVLLDLIVMKRRCRTAVEKQQMEFVERWFNSVHCFVC